MADDLTMLAEIAKARRERRAAIGEDLDGMLAEAQHWLGVALEHAKGKAVHGLTVVDPALNQVADRIGDAQWAAGYARRTLTSMPREGVPERGR